MNSFLEISLSHANLINLLFIVMQNLQVFYQVQCFAIANQNLSSWGQFPSKRPNKYL